MSSSTKTLTEGPLAKQIFLVSLPLALSNLLQVLFNMSDVAVVGRFAGSTALGAVGSTSIFVTLFTGFLIGLGNGINVLVARFYGARHPDDVHDTVHSALIVSLIAGVILLVVDYSNINGNKGTREANFGDAMWMGICQGISVLPGLSRFGLTISAGLFCGLSRKFAVKYSLLMSIPAVIGAFLVEAGEFTAVSMTVGKGFTYILGMIVAGVTGYLVIRFMLKLSNQVRLRYFAFYSFAAGILILAANYI